LKSLWQIFVPTQRNNPIGKKLFYSTRFHRVWDSKVMEITKGLTICTPTKGQWMAGDGKLFLEKMIPVLIFCTEEEINKICDMSASYYEQKAMFFYKVTDSVQIINYKNGKREKC